MSNRFEEKHAVIMDAAFKIFLRHGFAGTSMDKVAQIANVSKATLYNHFVDKNKLFEEVMVWHCQNLIASSQLSSSQKRETLRDKLKSFAHSLVSALLDERSLSFMRVIIFETGQFPELGKAIWKNNRLPLLDEFSSFLQAEQQKGRLVIKNMSVATRQFFGLIKENLIWPVLMGLAVEITPELIDEVVDTSVDMFLGYYSSSHRIT